MKKVLLAGFVIAAFVIYSLHQRHESSAAVVKPPSLTTAQAPAPSNNTSTNNSSAASTGNAGSTNSGSYRDGQYTGGAADAFYGYIQVLAVISGGRLTDVRFLQYPNDRANSIAINQQAMPYLKQEALQAQSANVNIVSGATDTSNAFIQSLTSALNQAHS